jgi:hypothetical protein
MGLCLVGHDPVLSKGGYARGLGLYTTFTFACPRSPGLVPLSPYVYLLMNSLVIGGESLSRRVQYAHKLRVGGVASRFCDL